MTDDPVPADLQHVEIYPATAPSFDARRLSGAAPMVDVSVGVLPGVHARGLVQLAVDAGPAGKLALCFMNRVCICSPAGCVASSGPDVTSDAFASHGAASGSVGGTLGGHNVHFVKNP